MFYEMWQDDFVEDRNTFRENSERNNSKGRSKLNPAHCTAFVTVLILTNIRVAQNFTHNNHMHYSSQLWYHHYALT